MNRDPSVARDVTSIMRLLAALLNVKLAPASAAVDTFSSASDLEHGEALDGRRDQTTGRERRRRRRARSVAAEGAAPVAAAGAGAGAQPARPPAARLRAPPRPPPR